jgi:hypothetical protein
MLDGHLDSIKGNGRKRTKGLTFSGVLPASDCHAIMKLQLVTAEPTFRCLLKDERPDRASQELMFPKRSPRPGGLPEEIRACDLAITT